MRLTLISLSAARRTLFLRVTQLVKSLCFLLSQQEVGLFGENFSYPAAQRPVCSRSLPPPSTLETRSACTDRSSSGLSSTVHEPADLQRTFPVCQRASALHCGCFPAETPPSGPEKRAAVWDLLPS